MDGEKDGWGGGGSEEHERLGTGEMSHLHQL